MSVDQISLIKPDDWHVHLRDGNALQTTVPHSARQFARTIVMPNLEQPVTTVAAASSYRDRILAAVPAGDAFEPLMTLYLTDSTSTDEIDRVAASDFVHAVKYYPAGATTNSENGVTDIARVMDVLEKMAERGVLLLLHGEVTDHDIDIFDRERVFIDTILAPIIEKIPQLKIVLEHITTSDAAEFVASQGDNVAATITAHHLLHNRNDLLAGGVKPHFYCLPILKRSVHQLALIEAATSGSKKFFLGTDSAPHPQHAKESACGCAGIYTAPAALELYAEVFDEANALDKLEGFCSLHGPAFYGLPVNQSRVTLVRQDWQVEDHFQFDDNKVIPFRAGQHVHWKLLSGPSD